MTASWSPTTRETDALQRHAHVQRLQRVDAVWPWLADRHGLIAAVDAPHAAHPERFNFGELAERIATAAAAFRRHGVNDGDVVALFAENSPRWLVADQGLMRAGAADAVRGASAPVEELRYILSDCRATALVVQNADVWRRLALPPEQGLSCVSCFSWKGSLPRAPWAGRRFWRQGPALIPLARRGGETPWPLFCTPRARPANPKGSR